MKQNDDIDYDFTHVSGGNGFAIIEVLGNNFYRVAPITRDGVSNRAFLAWGNRMDRTRQRSDPKNLNSPLIDVPLEGVVLDAVRDVRKAINTGRMKVQDNYIREIA